MTEIVRNGTITIKRKYVYWIIQLMFVIALALFMYSYMKNVNIFQGLQNFTAQTTNGQPIFVRLIYGKFGGGEFDKPMAVTVANNRIYISDTNKRRIQIFDTNGNPIKTFGTRGDKPGQFQFPYGVAADSKNQIYVADLFNGTISRFNQDGKYLGLFAAKSFKKDVTGPAGLAIKNDLVYVTDVRQSNVKVFDLNGKLIRQIGKPGTQPGQFFAPNAITVDNNGTIYVTDTGNQRIEIFDKNGKFLKILNGSPDGKGESVFVNPRGVGIDDRGDLYVVSNLTHTVFIFDKNGKQLYTLGGYGEEQDKFILPNGLFVDDQGRVYITDTNNQRVAVFQS